MVVRPGKKEGMKVPINRNRTVIFHYTNWCRACGMMKPVWEGVKKYEQSRAESTTTNATNNIKVVFKEVDEDQAQTPGIVKYPTILMVDEYGKTSEYPGGFDYELLRTWVYSPVRYDK
jgi:hypothetical protein